MVGVVGEVGGVGGGSGGVGGGDVGGSGGVDGPTHTTSHHPKPIQGKHMSAYTTTTKHGRGVEIEAPDMSLFRYHGPRSPEPGYEFDFGTVLAHLQYKDGRPPRTIHAPDDWIDYERLGEAWIKNNTGY